MIVFTNGCFDILHPGHVALLESARALGSRLIVGINSDESVRKIKGPSRPMQDQDARKAVLLALSSVDEVIIFDETTPENLIRQLRPDILVKGGDWSPSEIIGSDLVESYGGTVHSLPILDGYSSSNIVEKAAGPIFAVERKSAPILAAALDEHLDVIKALRTQTATSIEDCAKLIGETVRRGKKILICGNGGSAADAQHLAAEFVGRYETERRALPAIALTTDTSALTALANDYGFEQVFARQVEALANPGDCLIAISTSGNSPNVIAAVMEARRQDCNVIGMTGAKGKKLASLCDGAILVPSHRTARIQEAHITIAHIWCEMIDIQFESEAR